LQQTDVGGHAVVGRFDRDTVDEQPGSDRDQQHADETDQVAHRRVWRQARPWNSPVSVLTFTFSPTLMCAGTLTISPVSQRAGFCTLLTVSPRAASSVSTPSSTTTGGSCTVTASLSQNTTTTLLFSVMYCIESPITSAFRTNCS